MIALHPPSSVEARGILLFRLRFFFSRQKKRKPLISAFLAEKPI
jgi:hypothetical protein